MVSHWTKASVIFIVASALLFTGFFLAWYPHSVIEILELNLGQSGLTQAERDNLESSLSWWSNQGVYTYGSVSNFVLVGGILFLVYAILYSLISTWRESIRAKAILTEQQYASQGESDEAYTFQPEQTRKTGKTGFPIASGVLTIIASSVVMAFALFFIADSLLSSFRYSYEGLNILADGILGLIAFAFGLTGGIMTLKRKNFVFAVLGTCFLIAKGFMFIVATGGDYLNVLVAIMILALSILSLIFVSVSYKEFS